MDVKVCKYCFKWAFINYVDKMRAKGIKNVCFCPLSGYKNVHARGGGSKIDSENRKRSKKNYHLRLNHLYNRHTALY